MRHFRTVLGCQLRDAARSRPVLGYTLLLMLLTDLLFRFGDGGPRVALSLINVVLLLVPLVGLLYGTMYFQQARGFSLFLLAQPVGRGPLLAGLYGGLALPLVVALLAGLGLPFLWHAAPDPALWRPLAALFGVGILLTLAATALALLVAVRIDDRARGLATALLVWILGGVVFDGALLALAVAFSRWPLERPLLLLTFLNPLDLGRVVLLLQFDSAALLGYTGAVFAKFFGAAWGALLAGLALTAWVVVPVGTAGRIFRRRDL
ncbi:MAG TPA: ABC transporter permease subunit [Gemmatimonadales bacterium]|nr:ABC transporter permease subunit [Gemmatimonadales bacterium]